MGSCDWCGRSTIYYNHDACPDGYGPDELPVEVDDSPDPWEALLKASESPKPGR
jgi:hypothetical protein